jgi:hypothetical protein
MVYGGKIDALRASFADACQRAAVERSAVLDAEQVADAECTELDLNATRVAKRAVDVRPLASDRNHRFAIRWQRWLPSRAVVRTNEQAIAGLAQCNVTVLPARRRRRTRAIHCTNVLPCTSDATLARCPNACTSGGPSHANLQSIEPSIATVIEAAQEEYTHHFSTRHELRRLCGRSLTAESCLTMGPTVERLSYPDRDASLVRGSADSRAMW